ncbi:uncharacterized protein LOC134540789 [Bacillus rossius redtenbacheri]|uniref:uncharacterized protein LOC134540789 n=1 Tax=Bacillus rossius redtenbacheri TaxID=93214 RepID=UPI002FDCE651
MWGLVLLCAAAAGLDGQDVTSGSRELTSPLTTAAPSPGCACPSVHCGSCSLQRGACCQLCCRQPCSCAGLDCVRCNGTTPCCQLCCQRGPARDPQPPGYASLLAAGGQLVLPNLTVVLSQPRVVISQPQVVLRAQPRAPALCCSVDQPARCSVYGCEQGRSAVTCGPQCVLGTPLAPRCSPLVSWPYLACAQGWPSLDTV